MAPNRLDTLIARLEKGRQKTAEAFSDLPAEKWQQVIYTAPEWNVACLLAHFISSEEKLLLLARDIAQGGTGAPEGFDIQDFNAQEQERFRDLPPQELLQAMDRARQSTIDWVRTLDESQLDRTGRHPVLGEVNLETMITAIYGHQLLHMRELLSKLDGR